MPISPLGARIVRYLWIILITGLMLVAAYVSIGRIVMPRLANYQAPIEAALTERLGMRVKVQSLQGGWQGFQPTVKLTKITVTPPSEATQQAAAALNIQTIEMQLDVIASVLSKKPIFSSLMLDGVNFELAQNDVGQWHLVGVKPGKKKTNPLNWLLLQEQLLLRQLTITLRPQDARSNTLTIPEWGLKCGSQVCSSQGKLQLQSGAEDTLEFAANIYERPGDSDFQLHGYLSMPPTQLVDWMFLAKNLPPELNGLESLIFGGEVWLEWGDNQLLDLRGRVDLPEIKLVGEQEALAVFESLHSHFFWQRNTGQSDELWALTLDDFTFKWGGQQFESAQRRVALLQKGQQQVLRLLADRIQLQPLTQALLGLKELPAKLRDSLTALRPSGQLQNVHLDYPLDTDKQVPEFKLQARLNNVAAAAWKGAPTLVAVNGYLEVGPQGGQVDFDSENLALQFPKVFSDIWLFKKARGVVSWQREGNAFWVNGRDLQLKGELGDITGQFGFVYAKGEFEPRLSLLIGLENSRLPDAMTFVPDVVIAPKVGEWLAQAFSTGNVKRARFVLDQALIKGAPQIVRTLAMAVDAKSVDFSYHPDWPHLTQADVAVKIVDKKVEVKADSAHFYDLALNNIDAKYLVDRDGSRLIAKAALSGPLKDAWQTLTDTPLQKNIFALAHDFQFKGAMQGTLALDLPFKNLQKSNVEIDFLTRNASLDIPSLSVSANAIGGVFKYSSRTGLTARKVAAKMFGYPMALSVSSQKNKAGQATQFDMQGKVKVASLAPWVPPVVLSRLEGETDYQAQLSLGGGSRNELQIHSNLAGVEVSLPAPFTKTAEQASPFSFNLALGESQIHSLQYADKFAYQLRFNNKNYQEGAITVGPGRALYRSGSGIQVKGSLPELDFQQWRQLVEQTQTVETEGRRKTETKAQSSLISNISDVTLEVGRFCFFDEDYDQVSFNAKQVAGDWQIDFSNDLAQGVLNYYPVSERPLAVDFEYLYLPSAAAGDSTLAAETEKDALASWEPQQLPELNLRINQLFLGQQPYGRWAFNSRPHGEGVKLEALSFDFKGLQASGEMDWLFQNKTHSSHFKGQVQMPDVAAMLKAWNINPAMEGKNARFAGELNWPGSPSQFSLLTMRGPLSMKVDEGRVVDLQSLPLLGVLNFNTLTRRLRLDFSDLFKKGFSFDEAQGAFQFNRGTMQLTEPLLIDGPSAKFKVEGQSDLLNEQFDHDVIVVLPINDNISVVTTLAGLPQVGIPLYLFNRTFGGVLDRFTSINYRVTGDWAEPKIELNSFFDTKDLSRDKKSAKKRRPKR
jgi:uncharacterized protein (TIGR02099 family)